MKTINAVPTSNAPTNRPYPVGVGTQPTPPGTTTARFTAKGVSGVAAPLTITTFENSPQCIICHDNICLDDRDVDWLPFTYCKYLHPYHEVCIAEYYAANPGKKAPTKNPDSTCMLCPNPVPLRMPRWDGESYICPISRSELYAITPYVGPPMTFSLADFPMINAQQVTVALGFKGAPVINILDTSQRSLEKDPLGSWHTICEDNELQSFRILPPDPEKPISTYNLIRGYIKVTLERMSKQTANEYFFVEDGSPEPTEFVLSEFDKIYPERPYEDKDTPLLAFIIADKESKRIRKSIVGNYPIHPLEWCKPATQLMTCPENKDDISDSRPVLAPDPAPVDGGNSAITEQTARSGLDGFSAQHTSQSLEGNTVPQFDTLSFELSVTAPDSMDSLASINDMHFNGSEISGSVFKDVLNSSSDFFRSPQYKKFETDFQSAITKMNKDDQLWVRVKLKKTPEIQRSRCTIF